MKLCVNNNERKKKKNSKKTLYWIQRSIEIAQNNDQNKVKLIKPMKRFIIELEMRFTMNVINVT